jgi:hypothetical protein
MIFGVYQEDSNTFEENEYEKKRNGMGYIANLTVEKNCLYRSVIQTED